MADITWDNTTQANRKRRSRLGNRWLVAGVSAALATGDTFITGLRTVYHAVLTPQNATATSVAYFSLGTGSFIVVHGAGSPVPINILAVGR